ncbi:hypothetical protein [Phytopseudomonas straminea]|uniref:hypothetical protein n=1 Tax=Pseudomonas straminea TaxID=47882 RepID=UPI001428A76B|nr:hypothetical protein [Pseudomonas straminea]
MPDALQQVTGSTGNASSRDSGVNAHSRAASDEADSDTDSFHTAAPDSQAHSTNR